MKIRALWMMAMAIVCAPAPFAAQAANPDLVGSWEAETPDGPQVVVIRNDSSASFGEETVQWRIEADTIFILFGDEWVGYNFVLSGKKLTLSGGDLEEPVTLERIGPPPAVSPTPSDRPDLRLQ